MNKIGMITYKDIAEGKGRFLQAYALYSAILELGYDPEIINYYPIIVETNKSSIFHKITRAVNNPKRWSGYVLKVQQILMEKKYRSQFAEKRNKYESYIKDNIKITKEKYVGYESLRKANLEYNAYVCGSDQIWNPNFQGLDPAYYLKFAPNHKRIAYAPSLGTTKIDERQKEIIKQNIEGMTHISVREKSGAEIISNMTKKNVENVLDPTLLMKKEWWEKFAGNETPEKPYVLTFLFDNNKHPRTVAKEIANRYGYEVVSIPDSFADVFFKGRKEISIGPERFVSLFKNASFVCTQSFHGVILSLIYNRQFFVFNRDTKGSKTSIFSRISDLLEMVGLENRILKEGESLPSKIDEIDYSNVNNVLEEKRNESLNYLENAIHEAVGGEIDEVSSVR